MTPTTECSAAASPAEQHAESEPLYFLHGKAGGGFVGHAGKTLRLHADGTLTKISDYSAGAVAAVVPRAAHDAESFFAAIGWGASRPGLYWIRGRLTAAGEEISRQTGAARRTKYEKQDKKLAGAHKRDPACFEEFERRGQMIDVDSGVLDELRAAGIDIYRDPDGAARYVASFLPEWVRRGPVLWCLSGSSGIGGAHDARFHFFFWTDLPISAVHLKALLGAHNGTRPDIRNKNGKPSLLDLSVLHAVQPHYLAAPLVYDEASNVVPDPLPKRWGRIAGALPYSPLPLDLAAGGSVQPTGARVPQRVTAHTRVRTAPGDATTLGELAKRAALPKTSVGCERLIGDGPGLRGFHEPTRDAIFWRLVELIDGGSHDALDDVEPYLAQLQSAIDNAPKGSRDAATIAARRDINELRRMAVEGLGRAQATAAKRRQRREARVAPLFPNTEVPMAAAQADLAQFLDAFFADANAYHAYEQERHERHRWWREHRGDKTTGLFNHMRVSTRFIGPPICIAAHETGLAKSSGAQRRIASIDLSTWRVLYFAPNHAACEQVRADLAKLGVDAFVLKGIDFEDDATGPICAADQQVKDFAERANLAQASQRETACTICPLRNKCAYLAQTEQMRRPGVKILPHAFLQATIPGLTGEDAAPIFCAVLDEKFTGALKVTLGASWSEPDKGSTPVDKWARNFAARLADAPAQWGTQDTALRKLAERTPVAFEEHNKARSEARDALRADIRANGLDATLDSASLMKRQHTKFVARLCQLVRDQIDLKRGTLQGVAASWETNKDGARRLVAEISYRDLLPDLGCPILALDATHNDRLTDAIFAERRLVDYGGSFHFAEPIPPLSAPTFRRVRVQKPHERLITVPDAPASKTALGTAALKPAIYERVPVKLRKAGAKVVPRPNGKSDVFPPRQRSDSHVERVARALRWFTEGASHDPSKQSYSAGVFTHKELREFMQAHGMLGENVRAGHHGIGTALNDWQDVERFAVVGVSRLDEDQFQREAESFFALAPTPDVPRMAKRVVEAGIRLRDGTGYPVRRTVWDDERVDALMRQIGEAQVEQELGRVRSVWRTGDKPVTILVMANAVIDRTFDAVVAWDDLAQLTPFDVAASAGIVPTKASELHKLLPGLFASPRAAQEEVLAIRKETADPEPNRSKIQQNGAPEPCAKNNASPYTENIHIAPSVVFGADRLTALAGKLPDDVCDAQLVEHELTLKRVAKHHDHLRILVNPKRADAPTRYATATGKTLVSAMPAAPSTSVPAHDPPAAPHGSAEPAALDVQPTAPTTAHTIPAAHTLSAMVRRTPWELRDETSAPWPDLSLAPAPCAP